MLVYASDIPHIARAIDFLFGDGRKIIEARMTRNKHNEAKRPPATEAQTNDIDVIHTKEEALNQKVSEVAIKECESEVLHLLTLLGIYQKNYHLAQDQYARWGNALVPQIIAHNLIEAEDNIYETSKKLERLLSKSYGKQVEAVPIE